MGICRSLSYAGRLRVFGVYFYYRVCNDMAIRYLQSTIQCGAPRRRAVTPETVYFIWSLSDMISGSIGGL